MEIERGLGDIFKVGGQYTEDDKQQMNQEQRELADKHDYILDALKTSSSGGRSRSSSRKAPVEFDPTELEEMIKEEQQNIRDLRRRQAAMIEQGPGAIFSPFEQNYMTENLFKRDPSPAFPYLKRGAVYQTKEGTPVGITKQEEPFVFVGEQEVIPIPDTDEYSQVLEMLYSLRPR